MHYTELPNWPHAYPSTNATGILKQHNEDFKVTELPLETPAGEGEHIWLYVKKNGANTGYVAQCIADFAGVREMDVGYAGLKDRHAITEQWFSVYYPKGETPDFTQLKHDEFQVLQQSRHVKKLRRGDLIGNAFTLTLREIKGDRSAIETNLTQVKTLGVPNYFGAQRFGHDGGNVEQGRMMLAREIRVRNNKKKGIYLSAVRSFVFNEILAARINEGLWGQSIEGDVLDAQQLPTGAMWGRGRVTTTDQAQALETRINEKYAELCDGLEHAGLSQERRSLVVKPENFVWKWLADDILELTFALPAGCYATTLISEVLTAVEPARTEPSE